ncbi:MAG: LysM peptidoglycan-binding domain-containing protein [Pseudomonadota bacterium]
MISGVWIRRGLCATSVLALVACEQAVNLDRFSAAPTPAPATSATLDRPEPDARGVISYPTYQVAIAEPGDTVSTVAARVGVGVEDLARFNGLTTDIALRGGEVLVLPNGAPGGVTTATIQPPGAVDIESLAGNAIASAEGTAPVSDTPAGTGAEPVRHTVKTGETAFTIARTYGVSVDALADWNGLGANLEVRPGQILLVPPVVASARVATPVQTAPVTAPGAGSPTPTPPSATQPLPRAEAPAQSPAPDPEPVQDLASEQTAASDTARLALPVTGSIFRPFQKGSNEGIDISAPAGSPVSAADSGTVAAITRDTDQVPILVLRHDGGLLTVYANIDNIAVAQGDTVRRGQKIAEVRSGDPSFLHFETRQGFDSVDPMQYLN